MGSERESLALQETHALTFARRYATNLRQPRDLLTPSGLMVVTSTQAYIHCRETSLTAYLQSPPGEENHCWGRTIFSEIVFCDMMTLLLHEALRRTGMSIELASHAVDISVDEGQCYQKGADLYLARPQIVEGTFVQEPLCGIDVTIANGPNVNNKRRKPGLQFDTGMPVIVVPLKDLRHGPKQQYHFWYHLDRHVLPAVRQGLLYAPFHGLTAEEFALWRSAIRKKLTEGIRICKERIQESSDPRISAYPHLPVIADKLAVMERITNGIDR